MTMMTTERVEFRVYVMGCCKHILCWVNPRPPTYCPACGATVYPQVKQWAHVVDDKATIEYRQ
jgi:hypothetical protein